MNLVTTFRHLIIGRVRWLLATGDERDAEILGASTASPHDSATGSPLDGLEDPSGGRDRPDSGADWADVGTVHSIPREGHPGNRLRVCGQRDAAAVPCAVLHRDRRSTWSTRSSCSTD